MLFRKFVVTLFYPWLVAVAFKAYEMYTLTDLYENRVQRFGSKYALQMYHHNMIDFWNQAFIKHWVRILFTPWVFTPHPDIIEFGDVT